MILSFDVVVELLGGPRFEQFARAVEQTPDPAITSVSLARLVQHVYQHHDVPFARAVDIVERMLGVIGARVVPATYEMALGAARHGGRVGPREQFSIDDAFALAAADQLRTQSLHAFDIIGLDEGRGDGARGEDF